MSHDQAVTREEAVRPCLFLPGGYTDGHNEDESHCRTSYYQTGSPEPTHSSTINMIKLLRRKMIKEWWSSGEDTGYPSVYWTINYSYHTT